MSTKEFTAQEIAELNQTFDTANALTKWKFMQTPEYEGCRWSETYCGERVSYTLL